MSTGDLLSFGPYLLDPGARRLTRDGVDVVLGARHFDLLCLLAVAAGQVVSKEALIRAGWGDVAVTIGSVDQAIYTLRQTLTLPSGESLIETLVRRGVRFVVPVSRIPRRESDASIDAVLAQHRAWIEGRAALETLEARAIVTARALFEEVVQKAPARASAQVGLANACALQFEMTRTDAEPDVEALAAALDHAREACRLDAEYAEAWATLGFVLERTGRRDDALAAARHSIVLEPDNWRHHLRLSAASWGEERLREARRALGLLPGLAIAHWLAASVMVARQLPAEARRELVAGLASGEDIAGPSRFSGVALHWLLGLIALGAGDATGALAEFERELQHEQSGHLYARECAANTWYAIGATRLRQGDGDGARIAFRESLRRVPAHLMARAALGEGAPAEGLTPVDAAIARAIVCAGRGDWRGCDAAAVPIERLLSASAPGNAGWWLPLEPMLNISARPQAWLGVLARLRSRAA